MYNKKDFIGMCIRQGALGKTQQEFIKDIVWEWDDMTKVEFESGECVIMTDEEFEVFAACGEVEYTPHSNSGLTLIMHKCQHKL